MVMDIMEFKNLLMLGCLICCMSPCMSQICINDTLNNQLQCRYDCSDEVITDKCSQYNATIHPSIDGYCCPGYFLTNVTNSTCQRCRDNTFMPDINKCCGCIICMQCDLTVGDDISDDFCRSKIKNRLCKKGQDPTTPANLTCPFIMTSTGNLPTTKEVNTVQITSTSDGPVEVHEGKSERKSLYIAVSVESTIILIIMVLFVAFCCCVCYKCCKLKPGEDDVDGRSVIEIKSQGEITELIAAKILRTLFRPDRQIYRMPPEDGDDASIENEDGEIVPAEDVEDAV